MKCENCGKNDVTFVYRSNINGQVEEHHLCTECAQKLGYAQKVASPSRNLMHNFFGTNNLLGGGFFDDFFSPMPSLLGRMSRMLEDPFDDFFSEMPALGTSETQQAAPQKQEDLLSQEEQNRFSCLRELNAKKMEMKKAVREENFERAAQLRDEIRQLEGQHKAEKKQNDDKAE